LKGTIPSEITQLQKLSILRLQDNELSGAVPDLTTMKKLVTLTVYRNHLSGSLTLPSTLKGL